MTQKRMEYYQADKFNIERFLQSIPREYKPTIIMGYIIGGFFLLSFVLGLFTFPVGSLMSGGTEVQIEFGVPMTFFILDMENTEKFPLALTGLFVDTLIYICLAYIFNLCVNIFSKRVFNPEKKYPARLYGSDELC